MLKYEYHLFCVALGFLTRYPVTYPLDFINKHLNESAKYFPFVGILVGTVSTVAYLCGYWLFGKYIAIALSMAATIKFTGAFHEDGFADMCDAFGGGFTKEKILSIMKDSRLGTYGTIGLILMLGLKFLALNKIDVTYILQTMLLAHCLSRLPILFVIYFMPYVQDLEQSKSKPLSHSISANTVLTATLFSVGSIFVLHSFYIWFLIPLLLSFLYCVSLFKRKIGGYTGDCLGGLQQLTELGIYLTAVGAPWNFI